MTKQRKFMGQWVTLNIDGVVKRAKITDVEFHQSLKKPVFDLISQLGNPFRLTREELETYEVH